MRSRMILSCRPRKVLKLFSLVKLIVKKFLFRLWSCICMRLCSLGSLLGTGASFAFTPPKKRATTWAVFFDIISGELINLYSVNTNRPSISSFQQCPRGFFTHFLVSFLPLFCNFNFPFLSCTVRALFLPTVTGWCKIFALYFSHQGFFLALTWIDSLCVSNLVRDQGSRFIHVWMRLMVWRVEVGVKHSLWCSSFFGLNAPNTGRIYTTDELSV